MLSPEFTTQTVPSAPTPTSTAAPGIWFQLGSHTAGAGVGTGTGSGSSGSGFGERQGPPSLSVQLSVFIRLSVAFSTYEAE
jgi:hypothetical protein